MKDRCYYLSEAEHDLLVLYDLTRFVRYIPKNRYDTFFEDYVIPYDKIDELARVVYARKYKGSHYDKLVALVERLQEILEINPDIC